MNPKLGRRNYFRGTRGGGGGGGPRRDGRFVFEESETLNSFWWFRIEFNPKPFITKQDGKLGPAVGGVSGEAFLKDVDKWAVRAGFSLRVWGFRFRV